ncbi:2-oxoglutarate (2OG) and Fe(II)-dependent oxygenase superfamily protein [Rhynchospora pubera]|uniref:procollagen-proline 4-dioxygenase n=1 Tax=Rhynchospora pubera TaxID=906938 RepID=A0AAV8H8K6_9POAL|nr:2-oxoglutarate (2OG) and Fe(II)-dependent oxygenase superfamily protein [Rhynchospora pubera]
MQYRWLFLVFSLAAVTATPFVLSRIRNPIAEPAFFNSTRVTILSWKPRVFLYKKFLSEEECDHLIKLAKSKLEESTVIDIDSGNNVKSKARTSSGMFLDKRQDHIVASIEGKISGWTFLPLENAENIQVLQYEATQKYEPHFDYFYDEKDQLRGGHRYATVLMYLSHVKEGGETVFPKAEGWKSQPKDETFSECAQKGLSVKPVKGDAVLFYNLKPDAVPDPLSLHASCPVIQGKKWVATKWIRLGSFDTIPSAPSAAESETEMYPESIIKDENSETVASVDELLEEQEL